MKNHSLKPHINENIIYVHERVITRNYNIQQKSTVDQEET